MPARGRGEESSSGSSEQKYQQIQPDRPGRRCANRSTGPDAACCGVPGLPKPQAWRPAPRQRPCSRAGRSSAHPVLRVAAVRRNYFGTAVGSCRSMDPPTTPKPMSRVVVSVSDSYKAAVAERFTTIDQTLEKEVRDVHCGFGGRPVLVRRPTIWFLTRSWINTASRQQHLLPRTSSRSCERLSPRRPRNRGERTGGEEGERKVPATDTGHPLKNWCGEFITAGTRGRDGCFFPRLATSDSCQRCLPPATLEHDKQRICRIVVTLSVRGQADGGKSSSFS